MTGCSLPEDGKTTFTANAEEVTAKPFSSSALDSESLPTEISEMDREFAAQNVRQNKLLYTHFSL